MGKVFAWPIRVYYEDTDAGGVVYHSRYLNFLERARTEWLRTLGYEQDVLTQQYGIIFVVHRMTLDYLRPAHFNAQLVVHSQVVDVRRVSISFLQEIRLIGGVGCPHISNADASNLFAARVQLACLHKTNYRLAPIPAPILEAIHNEY